MAIPNNNCTPSTIQCHFLSRKSAGLILQNVKKSIRKIIGGSNPVICLNIGKPATPTNMANANAFRSKNNTIRFTFNIQLSYINSASDRLSL